MNAEMLSNTVDVEMICDLVKYSLTVSRASPHTYALFMNDSCLEVDLHRYNINYSCVHRRRHYICTLLLYRLSDGSLLLSLDGSSHSTYMREEVGKLVNMDNCANVYHTYHTIHYHMQIYMLFKCQTGNINVNKYRLKSITQYVSYRYHVVVDGKTCVFEKENDPRVLRYVYVYTM